MTSFDEDGALLDDAASVDDAVRRLLDGLDAICSEGEYASVEVERPWSGPNPIITGEFSNVSAIRWYLQRELAALLRKGASVQVRPSRPALDLADAALFAAVDESGWDVRCQEALPVRSRAGGPLARPAGALHGHAARVVPALRAVHELRHAHRGVPRALPRCRGPDRDGRQMPAWHHRTDATTGSAS